MCSRRPAHRLAAGVRKERNHGRPSELRGDRRGLRERTLDPEEAADQLDRYYGKSTLREEAGKAAELEKQLIAAQAKIDQARARSAAREGVHRVRRGHGKGSVPRSGELSRPTTVSSTPSRSQRSCRSTTYRSLNGEPGRAGTAASGRSHRRPGGEHRRHVGDRPASGSRRRTSGRGTRRARRSGCGSSRRTRKQPSRSCRGRPSRASRSSRSTPDGHLRGGG